MDTKYLTYITTMAEEKNMTKAAEKLYVSQSSLSHYLNKLEDEVGAPLFLRGKNELVLTPAGEMYVKTARQMIDMKNDLYRNISQMNNRGHLRMATTSQWGLKLLSELMPSLRAAFPSVTFELSHHDLDVLLKMISNGTIDFSLAAIGSRDVMPDTGELLFCEELLFAVPADHPYCAAHQEDTIPDDAIIKCFRQDTFIISKRPTANRYLLDNLFGKYNEPIHSINECTDITMTRELVDIGTGVSLIPVSGKKESPNIRYYHIDPPMYRYNIMMHRKGLQMNPPEQFFHDYVINYFKSA